MKNNFFLNKYNSQKKEKKSETKKTDNSSAEKIYFKKLEVKEEPSKKPALSKRLIGLYMIFLGIEKASVLLKKFREEEAVKIAVELLGIKSVNRIDLTEVESKFGAIGTIDFSKLKFGKNSTRELLIKAFGIETGSRVFIKALGGEDYFKNNVDFINQLSPKTIAEMLSAESAQISAFVLSMMSPKITALVLKVLPPERSAEIIKRISKKLEVSPSIKEAIIEKLKTKTRELAKKENVNLAGKDKLVAILKESGLENSLSIIDGLNDSSPSLALELKNRLFTFSDTINISKKYLSAVLRDFSDKDIAFLLKGAGEKIQKVYLNALSKKRSAIVEEEISFLGRVKKSDIIEKQNSFVEHLLALEQSGKISLKTFNEVYVE